eukprot:scaffold158010_cov23-Tisochrysis_lutea.AAC.1
MPEALWKAYIDFEISVRQRQRTRILYERLLDRTKHVKVWLSYASFEAAPLPKPEDEEEDQQQGGAQAAEEEEDEESTLSSSDFDVWASHDKEVKKARKRLLWGKHIHGQNALACMVPPRDGHTKEKMHDHTRETK